MENTIKKYQFKDGLNHEFEIVNLSKVLKTKRDLMSVPHRAQFYHIVWIEKGSADHFVDFNPIKIDDNTILFIPHNSVNKFDPHGEYEGKAIIFTDSFFCKNNNDLQFLHSSILFSDLYPIARINSKGASELKTVLTAMESEFLKEPDSSQYGILNYFLHIFLLQSERELRKQGFEELKPSANLDYLILFKDLLEEKFREEKSVKSYASYISISEKQLHKATTSLLDKTPKQIIDERVLLEAKRLLVHSTLSIKEVAYDLGYDEPTNFIKYFKKHAEMTPSDFREKY